MVTNSIIQYDPVALAGQIANQQNTIRILSGFVANSEVAPVMAEGRHYGTIPGTDKPTLLKPGAELLCQAFGLYADYEPLKEIENFGDDGSEPLFYYRYKCVLRRVGDGKIVATGIGSCNSRENKYGYRWVQAHQVPTHLDTSKLAVRTSSVEEFEWSYKKREVSGKYGKPEEYWQQFDEALADGTIETFQKKQHWDGKISEAYRITSVAYQIPNPEIASAVNTIDKMAQKRSLIAATLNGTAASEFFTQDIEDLPEFNPPHKQKADSVIEGEFEVVDETPAKPAQPKSSNNKKSMPENAIAARRRKVFAAFPDHDPTEVGRLVDAEGIDWAVTKSDRIIELIQPKLAPTGTDGKPPEQVADIPF